jgi:hypothetical protein
MLFLNQKLGNWYVGNIQKLNKKDLSVFGTRNILYPGLIFIVFLLPLCAYIIFRPSYVDPSWLCILLAGAQGAIVIFQVFQYIWLYRRDHKNK